MLYEISWPATCICSYVNGLSAEPTHTNWREWYNPFCVLFVSQSSDDHFSEWAISCSSWYSIVRNLHKVAATRSLWVPRSCAPAATYWWYCLESIISPVAACSLKDVNELMEESLKMKALSHPNILNLIGVSIDAGDSPYIVMPYMANGSLLSYLRKERPNLTIAVGASVDLVSSIHCMCIHA